MLSRGLDIDINRYPQIRWIKTFDYFLLQKDFPNLRNKLDEKIEDNRVSRYDPKTSLCRKSKNKKRYSKNFNK